MPEYLSYETQVKIEKVGKKNAKTAILFKASNMYSDFISRLLNLAFQILHIYFHNKATFGYLKFATKEAKYPVILKPQYPVILKPQCLPLSKREVFRRSSINRSRSMPIRYDRDYILGCCTKTSYWLLCKNISGNLN